MAGASSIWGTDSGNDPIYLFYSGLFAVLVFAAGMTWNGWLNARRHNCHVRGCWRLARRPVPGTNWSACNKHHPEPPPAHEHVIAAHRIHLLSRRDDK